jgi:hypothetical protein
LDGFVDIQKIKPEFNPLDRNIVEQLAADPVYKFLVDPEFVPNNWDYVAQNYDIHALYDVFVKYAPMRAFNLNDFSLLAKGETLTFEDVLAHELKSSCGRRLLGTDITYKNTVNIYLLDMVFGLYGTDKKQLKLYSLE